MMDPKVCIITKEDYETICDRLHIDPYNYKNEPIYLLGELLVEMCNYISELEDKVEEK